MPLRSNVLSPGAFIRQHLVDRGGVDFVQGIYKSYRQHLKSAGIRNPASRQAFSVYIWTANKMGLIVFDHAAAVTRWDGVENDLEPSAGYVRESRPQAPSPRHYYRLVNAQDPRWSSIQGSYRESIGLPRVAPQKPRAEVPVMAAPVAELPVELPVEIPIAGLKPARRGRPKITPAVPEAPPRRRGRPKVTAAPPTTAEEILKAAEAEEQKALDLRAKAAKARKVKPVKAAPVRKVKPPEIPSVEAAPPAPEAEPPDIYWTQQPIEKLRNMALALQQTPTASGAESLRREMVRFNADLSSALRRLTGKQREPLTKIQEKLSSAMSDLQNATAAMARVQQPGLLANEMKIALQEAQAFLSLVLPHLRVKRAQADIAGP